MGRQSTIAFIGFGEAAQAFCEGWGDHFPGAIVAYDRKTADAAAAVGKREDYACWGVVGMDTLTGAIARSPIVISVVTADQALTAASDAALALAPDTFFFDMNSVAPETKRAAAALVDGAGARYVDVAVMAPVHPALTGVPMLVSGPNAEAGAIVLRDCGFDPRVVPGSIGAASAIKMIRSIMIKGIEALTAECLLSARAAGVDAEVIASLDASFPSWNWRARGDYNLDRMLVHGLRRAAEMREAAATAAALGQSGGMAAATADWQHHLGSLALSPLPDGFAHKADTILSATGHPLP